MLLRPLLVVTLAVAYFTSAMAFAPPARASDAVVSMGDAPREFHPATASDWLLATSEGRYDAVVLSDAPGTGPAPSIVNAASIFYVLDGVFEFHVGDDVFDGGPGTLVSVNAGQPHGYIQKTAGKVLIVQPLPEAANVDQIEHGR